MTTSGTLRDHMAMHALYGMLAHPTRYRPRPGAPENWHDAIAAEAYELADAMIYAQAASTYSSIVGVLCSCENFFDTSDNVDSGTLLLLTRIRGALAELEEAHG